MLDWFWLDDDTCIFTYKGEEIAQCDDEGFDRMLAIMLSKYRSH